MLQESLRNLYRSTMVRAVVAFAAIALGASVLVGGCESAYVDGNQLSFSGTDLDGHPVSLVDAEHSSKVVLVEIWGVWCPACMASVSMIKDLHRRFADDGLAITAAEFATSYGGSREEYIASLREWARGEGVEYTIVQAGEVGDEARAFPELKSFQGFPTIILIGRDGTVRHVKTGYLPSDAAWYDETIRGLLGEDSPQQ